MKDELYPIIDIPDSVQRADKAAWNELIDEIKLLREEIVRLKRELEARQAADDDNRRHCITW